MFLRKILRTIGRDKELLSVLEEIKNISEESVKDDVEENIEKSTEVFSEKAIYPTGNTAFEENIKNYIKTYLPDFLSELTPYKEISPDALHLVFFGICLGDMIGMPYEGWGIGENEDPDTIPLLKPRNTYTDDSVMALATVDVALFLKEQKCTDPDMILRSYKSAYRYYAKLYPDAGYGGHFYQWAVWDMENEKYQSFGNGGAMRTGGIGAIFDNPEDVIKHAILSALPTHGHPEGIKGAVVTAICVWLALRGATKQQILSYVLKHYSDGYHTNEEWEQRSWMAPDLTIDELIKIQPHTNSVTCQEAVPEAIINFIHSTDYESCMRNAFRYQCDSDTVNAIAGGIAAAFYGVIECSSLTENIEKILESRCGKFWKRVWAII